MHITMHLILCLVVFFSLQPGPVLGNPPEQARKAGSAEETRKVVREGVSVELSLQPVSEEKSQSAGLLEGKEAVVRFRITDATTGTAISGLRPAAWIDPRTEETLTDLKVCREKIRSFLTGSLSARPEIDLNIYYVLTMNDEPSLSVVDPLFGFGGSKLLALVLLKSPGEDWVLSKDERQLFVTMPLINQVAVVDTVTWKVTANIETGPKPTRIARQPDGKYLWVGTDGIDATDAASGVTVIDADELKVAAHIRTGAGHHEIAFTDDNRYAFVTNKESGTLSILDVQKLAKVQDLESGSRPASLGFSSLSKAVYVTHEGDGTIVAVDGHSHQILRRMEARPGLGAVRFVRDGRWGFVLNPRENRVHIVDASTHRILQTAEVGKGPDQIVFTDNLAYVRSTGEEIVWMIPLAQIGQSETLSVVDFPGGQNPVSAAGSLSIADAIVPAPEGTAVLVANPVDKMIYYYQEGMAAPMGSFRNYGREPRAVLVVDRSLREREPGVYSTHVKLTKPGPFDVALLLDSPSITHCFDVTVKPDPSRPHRKKVALQLEFLPRERGLRVGEEVRLHFKLTDPATAEPKVGLNDVGVLTMLAPGTWQQHHWARAIGDGIYEITFAPPEDGVYYVFVQCPSLKVRYNQLPHLTLRTTKEDATPDPKASPADGKKVQP